jgi:hypothetical protein
MNPPRYFIDKSTSGRINYKGIYNNQNEFHMYSVKIYMIDSSSNRYEYQDYFLGGKGGRCLGLTTLPPSCAECLEIWEPQPPGALRACPGLLMELLDHF